MGSGRLLVLCKIIPLPVTAGTVIGAAGRVAKAILARLFAGHTGWFFNIGHFSLALVSRRFFLFFSFFFRRLAAANHSYDQAFLHSGYPAPLRRVLTVVRHELEFLEGIGKLQGGQHSRVGRRSDGRDTAGLQRVQTERLGHREPPNRRRRC